MDLRGYIDYFIVPLDVLSHDILKYIFDNLNMHMYFAVLSIILCQI